MKERIRIGVLGTATIAKRHIIPAFLDLKDKFRLIGISSRDFSKAQEFANEFSIEPYDGYEAILSKEIIDAVYIPLPNSLHYEWVKKALQNDLHVIVEKSLACSLKEVESLISLAKKKRLVILENFQFRFHTQLQFIKKLLEEGNIGELRCLRSSFGFPPFPDLDNIRYQSHLGGGALLDAGAYPIKISQIFLGHDLEVRAANLYYDPKKNVDLWGGAYLSQCHGYLFSEIAFGFDNYYQCNLELWGNKGKIFTNRIFTAPPSYEPTVNLENSEGISEIKLPSANHFVKMLEYFHFMINNYCISEEEYFLNINQARLIQELKNCANAQ